jgi:hypothetical protein
MRGQVLTAQTAPDAQTNVAALEEQVKQHLQEQKPQLAIPVLRQIVSLDWPRPSLKKPWQSR